MASSLNGVSVAYWIRRWVKLNVGGKIFLTTKSTLERHPDSYLYRLCQENMGLLVDKDDSGAYLIERNPNYFAPVLDYMRHGELILDDHLAVEGVLKEAEFFVLPDLVRLVELKIKENMKARLVELKMIEEWRLEEKLKIEKKLGLTGKSKPEARVRWSVRSFEHSVSGSDLLDEIRRHINFKLNHGAQLDRLVDVFQEGTIVIMKEYD